MPSLTTTQISPEKQNNKEEEGSKDGTVFGTNLLERWKNQNSFLDDIISKLAGKLPNVETTPSEVQEQETIFTETDDESEEESDEESEEKSIEESEEESEGESSEASVKVSEREEDSPNLSNLIEAETSNETGFLRIESVVSLNPLESGPVDDSLDFTPSVVTFSSIIIRKDECLFPYSAPHNRAQIAFKLKNEQIYQKMLERHRIKSFFKCMAFRCMYSGDSTQDFSRHIHWHYSDFLVPKADQIIPQHSLFEGSGTHETLTIPDFYLCSYCPNGAVNSEDLVEHINGYHGHCTFQCSACFFRAKSAEIVEIHIMIDHSSNHITNAQVLECRPAVFSSQLRPKELTFQNIPRYLHLL